MTGSTEAELRDALRRWVREHSGAPVGPDFTDATPLIQSRVLTSLQITDLLLHLEELRGEPLDVAQLRPGVFRDIDSIYATFLDPAPPR